MEYTFEEMQKFIKEHDKELEKQKQEEELERCYFEILNEDAGDRI